MKISAQMSALVLGLVACGAAPLETSHRSRGDASGAPEIELATKAGYEVSPGVTLGIESFNGLGEFCSLGHLSQNDHATYLTADFALGRWDINAGIGKGYGASADATVLKFVIGVPLGR